jgi:hypothetical protein
MPHDHKLFDFNYTAYQREVHRKARKKHREKGTLDHSIYEGTVNDYGVTLGNLIYVTVRDEGTT